MNYEISKKKTFLRCELNKECPSFIFVIVVSWYLESKDCHSFWRETDDYPSPKLRRSRQQCNLVLMSYVIWENLVVHGMRKLECVAQNIWLRNFYAKRSEESLSKALWHFWLIWIIRQENFSNWIFIVMYFRSIYTIQQQLTTCEGWEGCAVSTVKHLFLLSYIFHFLIYLICNLSK